MKDLALAEMEHTIQEMEAASYDGVFIWKIADFARKRQEAVAGRSPAIFSSGRESHRWEHPGGGGGAVRRAGQAEGSCASVPHGFLPNRLLLPSFCPAWPAFYTSKYGYKMCLRIYLNGDGTGRGTHLSLFFVVMKGPNDPLLRWPFNQKVGPWRAQGGKRQLGLQKGGERAWRGSLASQSSLSCPSE